MRDGELWRRTKKKGDLVVQIIVVCIYYVVALLVALVLLKAYKKKVRLGARIGNFMLATFFIIFFYSFNFISENFQIKAVGNCLAYFMMDVLLLTFLNYLIVFTGYEQRFPAWFRVGLTGWCLVDGVFFLTNFINHATVQFYPIPFGEGYVLGMEPGTPYHLHMIYISILATTSIAVIIVKCGETPRMYWRRYAGVLSLIASSILIKSIYLYKADVLKVDVSFLVYALLGIVMYFSTFHYIPLITGNITRRMILGYIKDPLVLFDYEGKLTEKNEYASILFPTVEFTSGKLTVDEFAETVRFRGFHNQSQAQEFEWISYQQDEKKVFQCSYYCMRDKKERVLGKLFLFHDVTNLKSAFFELEKSLYYEPVTGLYNKSSFYSQIPQWEDPRYWPLCLSVCNINGLKAINDTYGKEKGDAILARMAHVIRSVIGEETYASLVDDGDVVIVFENMEAEDAIPLLEKIRTILNDSESEHAILIEYGVCPKRDGNISIEKALQEAKKGMLNKKMLTGNSSSSSLVGSLKQTLSESDYETEEHVERTREMARRLGKAMRLSDSDVGKLELLAVLHDIGKVAVPHNVLYKKGRLTEEETKIMQGHTEIGSRIAQSSPELRAIADCILSHHERWDGTGYPNGLAGHEIPLLARIIAAVDAHDVMVHDRRYHAAVEEREAIAELQKCAGSQFDPEIITVFTQLLEKEEL